MTPEGLTSGLESIEEEGLVIGSMQPGFVGDVSGLDTIKGTHVLVNLSTGTFLEIPNYNDHSQPTDIAMILGRQIESKEKVFERLGEQNPSIETQRIIASGLSHPITLPSSFSSVSRMQLLMRISYKKQKLFICDIGANKTRIKKYNTTTHSEETTEIKKKKVYELGLTDSLILPCENDFQINTTTFVFHETSFLRNLGVVKKVTNDNGVSTANKTVILSRLPDEKTKEIGKITFDNSVGYSIEKCIRFFYKEKKIGLYTIVCNSIVCGEFFMGVDGIVHASTTTKHTGELALEEILNISKGEIIHKETFTIPEINISPALKP